VEKWDADKDEWESEMLVRMNGEGCRWGWTEVRDADEDERRCEIRMSREVRWGWRWAKEQGWSAVWVEGARATNQGHWLRRQGTERDADEDGWKIETWMGTSGGVRCRWGWAQELNQDEDEWMMLVSEEWDAGDGEMWDEARMSMCEGSGNGWGRVDEWDADHGEWRSRMLERISGRVGCTWWWALKWRDGG
jgi:hypothetical protein